MNEENGRVGNYSNEYEYMHHGYPPKDILVQTVGVAPMKSWILTICQSKI